jgi:hypothetical protein
VTAPLTPGPYVVQIASTYEDVHGDVWGLLVGGGMVRAEELRPLPAASAASEPEVKVS